MKLFVFISLLVLIVEGKSFARKSCRTCQDADCLKQQVVLLDCTKFVPILPFEDQFMIKNNEGDLLEYGCLEFEYYTGETLNHIEQCILTKDIESFCDVLEYSVKVNKCRIEPLGLNRTRRMIQKVIAEGDDSTDQPVTTKQPEPTTKQPEPTTKQPEPTTNQPGPTTNQPEPTTNQPESTTNQPESTTKQPESTTKQPESTAEPVVTTTEAVETTTSHGSLTSVISLMSFVGVLVLYSF